MTDESGAASNVVPKGVDALLSCLPAGVVFTTETGLILKANALFLEWLGYQKHEIDDKLRLQDLLSPGGRIFYETHIALLLKVNRELNSVALDLVAKTGAVMPVHLTGRQQTDVTGAVRFNCFTLIDARERRNYERELLAARKEAERSSAELSAVNRSLEASNHEIQRRTEELTRANEDLLHFAYAVSHDLQTPLRAITTFSQLLALTYKPLLGEKGEKFITEIVKSSTRMATMIADLLKFVEVAGDETSRRPELALGSALSVALETLGASIAEAGAVITHDPLPTVFGEATQLTQIFQNLIGNAIKYRKADSSPRIHISSRAEDDEWVVSVRDNGLGFEPEYAEKIFGVFQRLHGSAFSGTGIGLTICKRIAERHGGRIWAEATPGNGATFSFSLPKDGTPRASRAVQGTSAQRETRHREDSQSGQQALFDELFHTLDLARAVVRDLNGKILIWTEGAERLFGWTKSEALGRRIHDLLHKEFPKPLSEIEAELLRNGEWSGEIAAKKKDGSPVWLASHLSLHRDGSGRPQSVVEIHNGINALKEAEAALLRSSEQRDLALSASQMGTWDWDRRTGVVQWSGTIGRILGMPTGSFRQTFEAFVGLVHPEDIAEVNRKIEESLQTGHEYKVEFRLRRMDGSYCWLRGQGEPTFSGGDEPTGLVGVVWDNTERKQAELDQQFLLDLHLGFAKIPDAAGLIDAAVTGLGKYLEAAGCLYAEVDRADDPMRVFPAYHPDAPTWKGEYSPDLFVGFRAVLEANEVVVLNDVAGDVLRYRTIYEPAGVRAFLAAPMRAEGRWSATLAVVRGQVHLWRGREIAIVQSVAERLGHNLEKARLAHIAQEQRQRFEATFNQAAVGLAHVAVDGRWLHMNQRICEITGYPAEELLAITFQDITHPEDLQIDLDHYAALKRGETQSYSIEKRYLHKSGSIVWINLTVSLVRDATGEPKYAVAVVEDISARKQAQEALLRHTKQRDLALRAGQMTTWEWDSRTGIVHWSETIEGILDTLPDSAGFTPDAVPGIEGHTATLQTFLGRVHPEDRELVRQRIEEPSAADGEHAVEFRFLRRNGSYCWLRSQGEARFHGHTQATSVAGVMWDITERKQAETLWREAAERLKLATSAARLGVFTFDIPEDRMHWENARVFEIFGHDASQASLSGEDFFRGIVHSDDAAACRQTFAGKATEGNLVSHPFRIRHAGGGERWVEFIAQVEHAADGAPLRLVGVVADITDRKQAEAAANDKWQHLRNVLESLNAFVGVLSPEGVLLEANRPPLEAAGIRLEDVIGKYFPDTYWWNYSPKVQAQIAESIEKARMGESSRFDVKAQVQDGYLMTTDFMIVPLRDQAGEIRFLIPSATSVDERAQAEAALQESQTRLRKATVAARLTYMEANLGQTGARFADNFVEVMGFDPPANDYGKTLLEHVLPEDRAGVVRALQEWEGEGDFAGKIAYRVLGDDGNQRHIESEWHVEFDECGAPQKTFVTNLDVSDRARAVEALHISQTRLREALDASEVGTWNIDPLTSRFTSDERFRAIFGTSVEGLEIEKALANIHPDDIAKVREVMAAATQNDAPSPYEIEFRAVHGDGSWRWVSAKGRATFSGTGVDRKLLSFSGTLADITERKRTDVLLATQREVLELAAKRSPLPEMLQILLHAAQRHCGEQSRASLVLREPWRIALKAGTVDILELPCGIHDATMIAADVSADPNWRPHQRFAMEHRIGAVWSQAIRTGTGERLGVLTLIHSIPREPRSDEIEAIRLLCSTAALVIERSYEQRERERAEEALRENERQARLMLDSIDQLAWIARRDGYRIWFNKRWYEYTGTNFERMEGWGWMSLLEPTRLGVVKTSFEASFREGAPFELEVRLRGADGAFRPFLVRAAPVRDTNGEVVQWFGTNTNIEALRHAQNLLIESERQFRELAENLPDIIWASNPQGKITYVNPKFPAYTGVAADRAMNDGWVDLVHPEDTARLGDLWQGAMATGRDYISEGRIRRADGAYRWFLHRAQAIRDEDGTILKWLGVSIDIHRQKLSEQALRRSNEDLEQFAHSANHDLLEPLRTAALCAQLLAREPAAKSGRSAELVADIVKATHKMDSMLKGLLAYSSAGDATDVSAPADSSAALSDALRHLRLSIAESGGSVSHDPLPSVRVSGQQVTEVLRHLIDNSVTYRGNEPLRIHVSAVREGNWHKFSVRDNGIGMEAQYLERIFGMFRRLHRDEYPGVGVGLAICRKIVEKAGGRIWAESEPGHGTTFHFLLPAEDEN